MRPSHKAALGAGVALILAAAWGLPAAGQQQAPESLLPPGFGGPPPASAKSSPPAESGKDKAKAAPAAGAVVAAPAPESLLPAGTVAPPLPGADEAVAEDNGPSAADLAAADAAAAAAQQAQELPPAARRPLDQVGVASGYGGDAFGAADGRFLATLMRRIETPIASRWAEIMLRRVLLSPTPAPAGEGKADWVADRAALLLRLGEADGARMLVQAVDVDNFSARLRRVAMQTALATSDPAGLCPLPDGAETVSGEPAWPLIRAMCAALSGDIATANAMIGRGSPGDPIDHLLAEKLVAAAGAGRREVKIDWTAVDTLTDWRFGLATALNVALPQALVNAAPAWFQGWLARAPMLAAADRLPYARAAAALGPVSSYDLVDLYGQAMDESGEVDTDSPAGRLRAAYRGDDDEARLTAMHALWDVSADDPQAARQRYAAEILTARAAARLMPAPLMSDDVDTIVASLFAAGLDIQAERWAGLAESTDTADGDRAWAMLAVGTPRPVVSSGADRVEAFAKRAGQAGRHRTAMLAAALAGLGRLPPGDAARIAAAAGSPLTGDTPYGQALERAVTGSEPGTVALLVAAGMQTPGWGGVPAGDFYRMIRALRAVGLGPQARMIAAEAMARL